MSRTTPSAVTKYTKLAGAELPVSADAHALRPSSADTCLLEHESPAYKSLREAGLIADTYSLRSAADIDLVPANSDMATNACRVAASCVVLPLLGGIAYKAVVKQFCVKDGCIRCGTHSDGSFIFFGAGVHRRRDPFLSVDDNDRSLREEAVIENGNRTILTVSQGFVGLAFDRGQPIILPPGLHQWKSDTLRFSEMIDLSEAVIRIGPFTLLTVDEGYAAVTQNNGKQCVLPGGHTHMLTHRNWKFESFISMKIHTDDLGPFNATTADNVVLTTTATVNWRIDDPARAALMAADTMQGEGKKAQSPDANPVLRKDVLKQTLASLAAAIGTIRYADSTHVSANDMVTATESVVTQGRDDPHGLMELFNDTQIKSSVRHANDICSQYGVFVVNINVISACPSDPTLQQALSAGAVASAAAQQAEMVARGNAKARLIASQSEAEAVRIAAQAAADAERLRAQGKKDGAALLESSEVAVDLAKIERAGELISDKTTFFFGAGPQALPSMLANPKIVGGA